MTPEPFDLGREEFAELAEPGSVVTIRREVDVDLRPLDAYGALRGDYSFLLESADTDVSAIKEVNGGDDAGERARYSFVGFEPEAAVAVDGRDVEVERLRDDAAVDGVEDVTDGDGSIREGYDTLDALRAAFPDVAPVNLEGGERQTFAGGLVGLLGYDAVHDVWLEDTESRSETPDALFVLSTRNLVFDHEEDTTDLVFTPVIQEGDDPGEVYGSAAEAAEDAVDRLRSHEPRNGDGFHVLDEEADPREEYEEAVERAREHVYDGDVYQAVLSRERRLEVEGDVRDLYGELRKVNPSPYMYLVEFDDVGVVGSSPETLFSVHDRRVSTNPIAGTCGRGSTAVEDRRLAGEMLSDEKELSEHVMLVDLGRNDVRRVSRSASVEVEDFMSVVQYSHVQHIESTVAGDLRDRADGEDRALDAFDAARAIYPAGTLSGAPKIRAMEIVDDLEPSPRGFYGGGVGYFSWNGDSDFAITIRTAEFSRDGDELALGVRAGAGIVAESVPEREFRETEEKMDALLTAVDNLRREDG